MSGVPELAKILLFNEGMKAEFIHLKVYMELWRVSVHYDSFLSLVTVMMMQEANVQ